MAEKSLVVYCYKEDEDSKKNLEYFLQHGVTTNPQVHYVFIINNETCTVDIPQASNISKWVRSESQYDVITYKYLLEGLTNDFVTSFSYYFFLNSSCRGPFLPPYLLRTDRPASETNYTWVFLFQQMLKQYDLVAPIVEYPPNLIGKENSRAPFVHSYMFSFNKRGFKNFQVTLHHHKGDTTADGIKLERAIGRNCFLGGLRVRSLLTRFQQIELTDRQNWDDAIWNPKGGLTCYEVPGNYFGMDVHPYEILFVKNIRNLHQYRGKERAGISNTLAAQIENYTAWTDPKN